ncbi:MAG: hypothetical protein ABI999_13005 [Acidobacteriota bacterium]
MRNTIILVLVGAAIGVTGCNNAPRPVEGNTNQSVSQTQNDRPQTMIAHGENQSVPTGNSSAPGSKTKWTQGGTPIDTTELTAAVTAAEKTSKAQPNDAAAKKALSDAYLKRAVALTDARQYASALGDYRRAVKADASNAEAKQWIDQIIGIYDSMNKESPKEGEEPPPLPLNKTETSEKPKL